MTVVDEHFVPEEGVSLDEYLARGDSTAVHHLVRYRWACEILSTTSGVRDLLDIACGAGYGSLRIASSFPSIRVTGADYDENAIAFAKAHYRAENLDFVMGDAVRWAETLGGELYDCVVSFDTIEHVSHREIMLENIVDHLRPGGMLMLSTPVRSANVVNPDWEHHKIEYSRSSLYGFLKRYFEQVLMPDNDTLPCSYVFDDLNRDEIVYLPRMNPLVCRNPVRIELPPRS